MTSRERLLKELIVEMEDKWNEENPDWHQPERSKIWNFLPLKMRGGLEKIREVFQRRFVPEVPTNTGRETKRDLHDQSCNKGNMEYVGQSNSHQRTQEFLKELFQKNPHYSTQDNHEDLHGKTSKMNIQEVQEELHQENSRTDKQEDEIDLRLGSSHKDIKEHLGNLHEENSHHEIKKEQEDIRQDIQSHQKDIGEEKPASRFTETPGRNAPRGFTLRYKEKPGRHQPERCV